MSMTTALDWTSNFIELEDDTLFLLFEFIDLGSLASLCRTCRRLHTLVNESGWIIHHKHNQRTCRSLAQARSTWSAYESLKYDHLSDRAWREGVFIARPLSAPWQKYCTPAFAMSNHRIVYAACRELHFCEYTIPQSKGLAPGLRIEGKGVVQTPDAAGEGIPTTGRRLPRNFITGVAFVPDGTALIASFEDGSVTKTRLPDDTPTPSQSPNQALAKSLPTEPLYRAKHPVACLTACSHLFLSFSTRGEATLYNSLTGTTSNLALGFQRSSAYSAYLPAKKPSYAAFGSSDSESVALRTHSIFESGFCKLPSLALGFGESATADVNAYTMPRTSRNSALALSGPPPHFGNSEQIIVSGWTDGIVRVYDLRSPRRGSPSEITNADESLTTVPTLLPVMSMYDPVSRGIGTVASGGGEGCYIAASSLMNNSISFWDVRCPREVLNTHAPVTTDQPPVYALEMESTRLFGATGRRPFIYDFGPGVTSETYPAIETSGGDGLALEPNGVGYRANYYRSMNDLDVE
ncbi:hypothetical protein SCHPADRAFT_236174 [Schizopora paradoxa]|uniref:F-box domain-containing protein n=1 Tax=Schizopora paradoxa TaxID=27342 RepID=A0A0H2SFX4_9AGAM|nr:hypothetical protein SCHPADRAFT_236174 [Schizopora paradoxa]